MTTTTTTTTTTTMHNTTIATLVEWLNTCPTPFHVVEHASNTLLASQFVEATQLSGELPIRGFFRKDGALIAWVISPHKKSSFHIVGAHTDSPNLRLQPQPDLHQAGFDQLGIEVYGGALLNSWLDRDLGIAGRIITRTGDVHLFNVSSPIARVPQLAIHLDRDINEKGLLLNKQTHITPVWGTHSQTSFLQWLSIATAVPVDEIVASDAHLYDITPATLLGHDQSLLASGRLDNQLSCWASITALCALDAPQHTAVVVLNDHEEVGSVSTTGADGPLLDHVLTALSIANLSNITEHADALRASRALSVDNAHALHPNYQERHEPKHAPVVNKGPALKVNSNQRYATSSTGVAYLRSLAHDHGIPMQTFVSRNDMPCGSTIGPITAARLGIDTIDIGVPQLSMHSAREMCGSKDPVTLLQLLNVFLSA
jgi:aspartyl aminopeptidase